MNNENKRGLSYQDSPHKEGAYSNTAQSKPSGENISHGISEMMQDSEEQLKGRENDATESDKRNNEEDNGGRQGNSSI